MNAGKIAKVAGGVGVVVMLGAALWLRVFSLELIPAHIATSRLSGSRD